jgi:myo-inositol-1(or 4)-monophosphatase
MLYHPIVNVAIDAARKAGDVITRALERLDEVKVIAKKDKTLTTDVDQKAEQLIIKILSRSYPDYGFLCEESGEIKGDEEYTWIIDPLDGTTNFVHGYPHFCVSIALKHGDNIEHGVIYDPIRQELFTATRGRGAQMNNHRLRVAQRRKLDGALISIDVTDKLRQDLGKRVAGIRHSGSAALDLAYVAAGRLDGCIDWHLAPWDVAAGSLLVQEAGGVVTEPPGQLPFMTSGCVLAANASLIAPLIQAINV